MLQEESDVVVEVVEDGVVLENRFEFGDFPSFVNEFEDLERNLFVLELGGLVYPGNDVDNAVVDFGLLVRVFLLAGAEFFQFFQVGLNISRFLYLLHYYFL